MLQLSWQSQRPFLFHCLNCLLKSWISLSFLALYHVLLYLITYSCMSLYLLVSHGFSEKYQCTCLPTLSWFHLYSFWASLSNLLESLNFCTTHPRKSFVNIALDMFILYRLFVGSTYQRLGASFQITFSHPSSCVVILVILFLANSSCILFSVYSFFLVLLWF